MTKMASIALTFREKVERDDRNDLKKVKVTIDCLLLNTLLWWSRVW